jgi:hypothetical protein
VKELCLRGISTPEAGKAYLPEFWADYNDRFAREPQSPHDAHRPVRDDEDLALFFTWQEERKLTKNLTLHYERVTYLVEPGTETLPLAGERCCVHEYEDGRIEVRHAGKILLCRVFFDKNPHALQGAIVAHNRLVAVLMQIQADQRERDRQRMASPSLTLRQKRRIRAAARHRARAPVVRPQRGPAYRTFLLGVDKTPLVLTLLEMRSIAREHALQDRGCVFGDGFFEAHGDGNDSRWLF